MRSNLTVLNKPAFVPLRNAILCLECNFVSSGVEDTCCVCHGTLLLNLAALVAEQLEKAAF